MSLNEEQEVALALAKKGASFFLTGKAGTGKTYILERIRSELEARDRSVAITAMTGCAALLLGRKAKTLHSWAGIGLGREPASSLAQMIKKTTKLRTQWRVTDTLILDEVSMLSVELLEKLDAIAKEVRKSPAPMGGLQCIFVGDFFQLPPVNKGAGNEETVFVFESPLWKQIVPHAVELIKIIRQTDPVFQKILQEARHGELSQESITVLKSRQGLPWQTLEIKPTLLFSRKAEVDHVNQTNLKALKTDRRIYKAMTTKDPVKCTESLDSERVKQATDKLDRDAPYSAELVLAIGAQVMLITNLNQTEGLVNGSRGIVVGFDTTELHYPIVKFRSGAAIPIALASWESDFLPGVNRSQVPLILAYAMTIHKSQGATIDSALIDIGHNTFESGQAYVALSRVRSLESLYIWDLEKTAFITHAKVKRFYQDLSRDTSNLNGSP
jgi:ATP-dependent DNA helicase PIF1